MKVPPESVYAAMARVTDDVAPSENVIIERILSDCFGNILTHLPLSFWFDERHLDYRGPTIPLHDALDNCGKAITDAMLPILYDKELVENGLLSELRHQILDNEARMNGLSLYGRRSKHVPAPQERDEPPRELCFLYFRDTPFLEFFNAKVPFQIPRETYAQHAIAVAPSGFGKTQLIGSLVHAFLQEEDPPGLCVLDPAGDLFDVLVTVDHKHRDRLLVLDPEVDPPELNFLDLGTSEEDAIKSFDYLMSALSGGLSDKQEVTSLYLLKLLRLIPGASIDTLRKLVGEKVKSAQKSSFWPYIERLDETDKEYFIDQFYGSNIQPTKAAIGWKLYGALGSDTFRKMFNAPRNSFDAYDAIQRKKIVLVKGARNKLRDHGMAVFLQFIVSQYYSAALKRQALKPHERHLCVIFADEASHIFNPQITNVLTECRKFGVAFFGATQMLEQIPTEVKAAVYGNTAIKMASAVAHDDAVQLAKNMYCDFQFMRGMKPLEFAVYVAGMTNRAVKVSVPYGALEHAPRTARETAFAPTPSPQSAPIAPAPAAQPLRPVTAAQPGSSDGLVEATEPLIKPGKEWE
jgi:hypothetical protein